MALFHSQTSLINLKPNVFPTKFYYPTKPINLKPNVFPTKFYYPTKPINLKPLMFQKKSKKILLCSAVTGSQKDPIFYQKDSIFPQKNSKKTLICSAVNGTQGGGAMKEQKWTHEGLITESLSNGMFKVGLENGDVILGHVSGKIRQSHIRILPGDRVKIEVSRYDSTRGRITYRLRSNKGTP